MISKISSNPTYDAYYELPEGTYENKEINADDFDQGEYVLEIKKTKVSGEVKTSNLEKRKPGHKKSIEGVYDDLYCYDLDRQTSVVKADKTLMNDKNGCSRKRKIFVWSIIGICVIGAIAVGVIYSVQGIYTFKS